MAKEQKPSNNFNVSVAIPDIGYDSQKVNSFYVFRTPMVKQASFAALVLQMGQIGHFRQLEDLHQQNKTPTCTVKVSFADPKLPAGNSRQYKDTKNIINKSYVILNTSSIDSNVQNSNQMVTVKLLLANPILWHLQNANGFNKILETQTAMDALLEYEGWLPTQHGDTAFEFKKVGEGENLNSHSYEHIQIKLENDLQVPKFLLEDKKALNSFGYYFFDDFRITPDKTADICGLLINLVNKDLFKQVDITDYEKNPDAQTPKILSTSPQFNPMSSLSKGSARTVGRDPEGRNERNDDPGPVPTPWIDTTASPDKLHGLGRDISASTPIPVQKDKPTSQVLGTDTPDSVANGNERVATVGGQFSDTLRAFHIFDIDSCYPDLYQFDCIYNLESTASSVYGHVPISIINIFKKDGTKPSLLVHGARVQTIKFKE